MVGVYKSMLPYAFCGTMPYPSAICVHAHGTHILDGRRNVKLGLVFCVQPLLEGFEPLLHGGLHRSALLQSDRALLNPFQRLRVLFHHPANSDPVLGRSACQDMLATVNWLSSKSATFSLRLKDFLALQMTLKHEAAVSQPRIKT